MSKTEYIRSTLAERINSGVYGPSGSLPSEKELGMEFDASRLTVRNALQRLEDEKLVIRLAGRGTFVLDLKDQDSSGEPTKISSPVALLAPQLIPSMASPLAAGCSGAALAHRIQLLFCDTGGASWAEWYNREILHLRSLLDQDIAGIIIYCHGGESTRPWLERIIEQGKHIVMIDRCLDHLQADFVGIDDEMAAFQATHHLIRLGHREIAHITHPLTASTAIGRVAGYQRALQTFGLCFREEAVIIEEEGDPGEGARAVDRLLQLNMPVTAVLAVNDYLAIQIIEALRARGVRVPEDIAVASFADMEVARHYQPPLTTIHQPFRQLGETAVHLICERVESGRHEPRRVLLPSPLVIRESCGSRLAVRHTPDPPKKEAAHEEVMHNLSLSEL